ncbi:HXXEE domain-containing protein [Gryllotalpicola koreensis]|uniref:HXXEE domain-containing protein n=1 Tax=Gryllotalpicola koreensis TaxID=993086 RepID=A0ABP7ZY29_9MICO
MWFEKMWESFETYWSSVGLGMAIVLLALLFFTNVLRQNLQITRWKDPVWLAWAMAVAYMLHNFEEYGIDALGRSFHFPVTACETFGFTGGESCPLTPAFFVSVNIPCVWIAFVLAALLSRRNHAIGLTASAVLFTNALSHLAVIPTSGYTPGAVTAAVIFIPLSLWVFFTQFGRNKVRIPVLVAIFLAAIVTQGVLLLLLMGLATATITEGAAMVIMTLAASPLILFPWAASAIWPTAQPPRVSDMSQSDSLHEAS